MLVPRASLFTTGLILGIVMSWALGIAYLSVLDLEAGSLAIPLGLTAVASSLLMRQERLRWIGFGLLAGAVIETLFFVWLFAEWSRGLEGL